MLKLIELYTKDKGTLSYNLHTKTTNMGEVSLVWIDLRPTSKLKGFN